MGYPNQSSNFPCIREELKRHFIRGLWDADGSFYVDMHNQACWKLTGSLSILPEVRKIIMLQCKVQGGGLSQDKEGVYTLRYIGNIQVPIICNWMYTGATIYLERKYNKYHGWLPKRAIKANINCQWWQPK
jgi:hypothetical protein